MVEIPTTVLKYSKKNSFVLNGDDETNVISFEEHVISKTLITFVSKLY